MRLAPEGRPFVGIGLVILSGFVVSAIWLDDILWVGAALWLPIAVWIPLFFRDPDRPDPRGGDLVISPADGRVVSVEELDEPDFLGGTAIRVSVFMNVFNVHVNRHPVSGQVEYRDYRPGKFFNATLDKASVYNERMSLGIKSPNGPILVRQIAGLIARRIVTDHGPGEGVQQGQRLGLIRFGSRVDTFLPPTAQIQVEVGQRVFAGQSVLAKWSS